MNRSLRGLERVDWAVLFNQAKPGLLLGPVAQGRSGARKVRSSAAQSSAGAGELLGALVRHNE